MYMKPAWVALCLFVTCSVVGQDKSQFENVNLSQLKKTVMKQLIQDDLIGNKREMVYLFLRADGISVNGERLEDGLQSRYKALLSGYEIGTGPDRTIFITPEGTAVGDFTDTGFHGKGEGKFNIGKNKKPWQ